MTKSGCAACAAWPLDPNGGLVLRANESGWTLRTDPTGQYISVSTVRLGKLMSSCGVLGVSSDGNPTLDLLKRNHGETPVRDILNTFRASLDESWANRYDP